jgi:putative hemolysin
MRALTLCLLIVAWLTAGATAVRSASRIWLRHWAERRLRGSPSAELYLERPQRLVLAAATGVATTVYVAGTLIGAPATRSAAEVVALVIGYSLLTLIAGQLVPRAIARRWPSALIPVLLPVLRLVDIILVPMVTVARQLTRRFERPEPAASPESETDGLEDLLREGELEGVGEAGEIAIISGVVQVGHKTLRDVMTARDQVFALEVNTPREELVRAIARSGYSRVPIYRGTLDDVVGMVHVFDVLTMNNGGAPRIRPVAMARATAPCNDFLRTMLRGRTHLAIVRDDAGRTLGIVTLEDLLEELVGDIRDEHDEPGPGQTPRPPTRT